MSAFMRLHSHLQSTSTPVHLPAPYRLKSLHERALFNKRGARIFNCVHATQNDREKEAISFEKLRVSSLKDPLVCIEVKDP